MLKILLDTDIGGDIDDAICLAYLLKEPQCDLLGITTVCGEPEKRAAVADAICRAAGRQVPIVAGLDTTLQPVPLYPTPDGAGALEQWPHSTYEKGDAPEFLYEKIRENPHQVVLIAIGNLTNVATLFTAHPDAVGLLKGLSVMNGYFGQERLPEPLYNWNSWADPMASKIVFASAPASHRAVPLEVTDTLTIEAGQAKVLFPADSPLLQAVYAFGNAWLESSSKLTLHDPLAALCWSTATPTAGTPCAPWQGTATSSLTRTGSGTRRPTTWGCSCGSGGRTTPRTRSKRARSGAPISTS